MQHSPNTSSNIPYLDADRVCTVHPSTAVHFKWERMAALHPPNARVTRCDAGPKKPLLPHYCTFMLPRQVLLLFFASERRIVALLRLAQLLRDELIHRYMYSHAHFQPVACTDMFVRACRRPKNPPPRAHRSSLADPLPRVRWNITPERHLPCA